MAEVCLNDQTSGFERIPKCYANSRLPQFAYLCGILPNPLVFRHGYSNTENVLYCLSVIGFTVLYMDLEVVMICFKLYNYI